MGSDTALLITNLILYKWLSDTEKRDLQKARLFGNLFRYTDDLRVISKYLEITYRVIDMICLYV